MLTKLLPILGITFVDILGFSMLIPMLPYFATHFGASPETVGLLFATFSLCQLGAGPLWGALSDRIGRKRVLIVSQAGATVGWAMLAFAPSLAWVFIARIVEGISGGNIGVTQAYVADLVEAKDRARAFGYIGAAFGAAMIFGPLGGGLLFARYGFTAPFLAASALQLLTLLLTITLLPESLGQRGDEADVGVRTVLATFGKRHLRPILLEKLALSLALYGWFAVIALYLRAQLGMTLEGTDLFFSLFAASNVIVNTLLVGRISHRLGDRVMTNLGLVALLSSFLLVPLVHADAMLVLIAMLFTVGMALANNGITARISNASSDREQGTVLGVSSSLDSLSGVLAPPLSTGLLGSFGAGYAGIASAAFSAVALGIGVMSAPTDAKQSTR